MDKIVESIAHISIVQALAPLYINEELLRQTGFVLYQKIKKMPLSIRIPIYTATFIFDWAGVFYGGCRFSVQNSELQQKMFHAVERYDWHPLKQFLKFYQKLSIYIYYSLLAGSM